MSAAALRAGSRQCGVGAGSAWRAQLRVARAVSAGCAGQVAGGGHRTAAGGAVECAPAYTEAAIMTTTVDGAGDHGEQVLRRERVRVERVRETETSERLTSAVSL